MPNWMHAGRPQQGQRRSRAMSRVRLCNGKRFIVGLLSLPGEDGTDGVIEPFPQLVEVGRLYVQVREGATWTPTCPLKLQPGQQAGAAIQRLGDTAWPLALGLPLLLVLVPVTRLRPRRPLIACFA